jgi:hypothetical protein
MSTDVDTDEVVGRRPRSPNHPVISLEDALKRATLLIGKGGAFSLPIGVVHDRLKYKRFTALAERIVGALAAYGMITVKGEKESRQVAITDRCQRILKNAPDKRKQLEDAALAPAIHRELWDHWEGRGVPPDDVLRNYLLWERDGIKFTEASVDDFIANFRATLAFAGLQSEDKIDEGEDDSTFVEPEGDEQPHDVNRPVTSPNPFHSHRGVTGSQSYMLATPTIAADGTRELPITLPSLNIAILRVKVPMDEQDYSALENSIKAFKNALVAKPGDRGAEEEAKSPNVVVRNH